MVCDRLREAGVAAVPKGDLSADSRDIGSYGVYVEDDDIDRAREILAEPAVSEAELIQAEEEDAAAREARTSAKTQMTQPKGIDPRTGKP